MTTEEIPAPDAEKSPVDMIEGERRNLYRLALGLTRGHRAEAEDLVQEAMLRAVRAIRRFQPGTSMAAWTCTIMQRLFWTRATQARLRRTVDDTSLGGPLLNCIDRRVVPRPSSRDQFLEEVDERIRLVTLRLPEEYKECFFLRAADGLTYAEIAAKLGVPMGTVMSRLHRAREMLREDLIGHPDIGAIGRRRRK